jgi:hypothetical protein
MNGHRPRDSYRTRVFAAEDAVRNLVGRAHLPQFNETEARRFVKSIELSRYWKARSGPGNSAPGQIDVSYRIATIVCDHAPAPAVAILRPGHNRQDRLGLLHALAHHVAPTDETLHGVGFGKAMLELVKQFAPDLHDHVKKAFKDGKVKTRTRTMTPEAKQAAADRLRNRHVGDKKADLLELLDELTD